MELDGCCPVTCFADSDVIADDGGGNEDDEDDEDNEVWGLGAIALSAFEKYVDRGTMGVSLGFSTLLLLLLLLRYDNPGM